MEKYLYLSIEETYHTEIQHIYSSGWLAAADYVDLYGEDFNLYLLSKNAEVIKFIKTPTLKERIRAVQTSGSVLKYIKQKTKEICEIAVKSDPSSFLYVPRRFQTIELCEYILDNSPYYYKGIQSNVLREKYSSLAVHRDSRNLQYIPEQSDFLCELVISKAIHYAQCGITRYILEVFSMIRDHTKPYIIDLIEKYPALYIEAVPEMKKNGIKEEMIVAAKLLTGIRNV